ncbi:MAG: TetR/AcrR family transcriptional regulator [Microbacteriaceae bacterium]|nr:TetR/AcrR family transcriptional regulator [Microbacteriaceae bacterium]
MSPPNSFPVSRQQVVGSATRAETRRRLLVAAGEEFAERGYTAATVGRISQRAGVTVQTLYLAWGSKRALLHGYLESVLTDSVGAPGEVAERFAGLTASAIVDELAATVGEVAKRSAVAWKLYRDTAGTNSEIAADWQEIQDLRRGTMQRIVGLIPAEELREGLTPASAANTAWVVASPESYDLLVRTAGQSIDQYVEWMAATLRAALLH